MKDLDLKVVWESVCNDYLRKFAYKHEYDIDADMAMNAIWVGNDPGTVACIGDMFIGMDDIRYDLDNNIPEDYFETWYWKHLDRYENGLKYMNYESFCKGCPDPITEEQEEKLRVLREKVAEAKKELEEAIKSYNVGYGQTNY